VRAEVDEFEASLVRLAIDQHLVGSSVTVAVITPFAAERMIEIMSGQLLILRRFIHCLEQLGNRAACRVAPPSPSL
jgi:hypothetical protein